MLNIIESTSPPLESKIFARDCYNVRVILNAYLHDIKEGRPRLARRRRRLTENRAHFYLLQTQLMGSLVRGREAKYTNSRYAALLYSENTRQISIKAERLTKCCL